MAKAEVNAIFASAASPLTFLVPKNRAVFRAEGGGQAAYTASLRYAAKGRERSQIDRPDHLRRALCIIIHLHIGSEPSFLMRRPQDEMITRPPFA